MSQLWHTPIIAAFGFTQELTVMEGVQGTGALKSDFFIVALVAHLGAAVGPALMARDF